MDTNDEDLLSNKNKARADAERLDAMILGGDKRKAASQDVTAIKTFTITTPRD